MTIHTGAPAGRAAVPAPTPYEVIGGAATVRSAVDRLYFWIARDDDLFNRYFRDVNLGALKAHMVALLTQTLGGPKLYSGKEMGAAHQHLRITPEHYRRVEKYVIATLLVEQAPWAIIDVVRGVLADLERVIVTNTRG